MCVGKGGSLVSMHIGQKRDKNEKGPRLTLFCIQNLKFLSCSLCYIFYLFLYAACERLILLETDPKELRDYSILLYHCGLYEDALKYLNLYQEIKVVSSSFLFLFFFFGFLWLYVFNLICFFGNYLLHWHSVFMLYATSPNRRNRLF